MMMAIMGLCMEWPLIRALMLSRLIALDKKTRSATNRSIYTIGEVLRRLMGKVMVLCTGADECACMAICSGLRGGIEGTIHAVREMFESHSREGYGVLMVDAKNALIP